MIQAERALLKTDAQGNLIGIPKLPPNINLEVIFLLLGRQLKTEVKRQPPSILKGTVTMLSDDLLEPMLSDEEWDASLDRTVRQIAGDSEAFK